MAIIYSYPDNSDLLPSDILVGTSTKVYLGKVKNETKNFSLDALSYFTSTSQYNTLNTVLNNGNNSQLDANVGGLGLYDLNGLAWAKVKVFTSEFRFYSAHYPLTPIVAFDENSLVFNNMSYTSSILTGSPTANRTYTLPNNSGTIALTSDIPAQITLTTTGTSGAATLIGNTLNIPIYSGGVTYTFNAPLTETGGSVSITQATTTTNGYLSSTDWNAFSNKQNAITLTTTGTGAATLIGSTLNIPTPPAAAFASLTTTGSSGSSTLISGVLNVPTYTLAGLGGITLASLSSTATGLTYTNTTGVFSLTAGYSIPTTSSQANWDTAYTNRITSLTTIGTGAATLISNVLNIPTPPTATFTSLTTTGSSGSSTLTSGVLNVPTYTLAGLGGVPTSRTLTINGVAQDLSADRSWNVGTVTSVGLSMPSAFTVTNSPITSSGDIAVTGAGSTSQYVRGDGTLANFPTSTGGGSSFNYYLNGSVSQGTFGGDTYYEMSRTPILGAGTNFTRTNGAGNGYIASFITDAGDPSLLNIPGGNWNLEFYFQASSGGGSPQFYAELYKVDVANAFTLVASGSTNPEGITNGTTVDQYYTSIPVPQTSLLITDRLAIRIYVITGGRTITLHTENGNLCEVLTTFSTGLTALNGLTQQVQYFAVGTSGTDFSISSATDTHTFNLPTASATNRGALSSADWTAFNGKFTLPSLTSGSVIFSNGTTLAENNANFFWDDSNSRLGIGTTSPAAKLHVDGNMFLLNSATAVSTITFPNGPQIEANGPGGYFKSGLVHSSLSGPTAGNVGIGTTSPEVKLDILGSGTVQSRVQSTIGGDIRFSVDSVGRLGTYSASDLLLLSSGTERMRITSSGNVGIGTTSPLVKLQVQDPSNTFSSHFSGNNQTNGVAIGTNSSNVATIQGYTTTFSATNNIAINPDGGNVGIGTASPGVRFVNSGGAFSSGPTLGSGTVGSQAILSNNGLYGMYSGVSSNGDVWHQVQRNDGNTAFYNLALQPSGGNIYIGTNAPIYGTSSKMQFLFDGLSEFGINFRSTAVASIPIHFTSSTGTQTGYIFQDATGVFLVSVSDYRLKEDLKSFNGLDLISKINVYDYKWKDQDKRSYGVLAHELQEVVPQAAFGEKDGERMQGVDYSKLVPVLIQAIQEQQRQIDELKKLI
jgi:hypothetical protein